MTDYLSCCFYFNRHSTQQHSTRKFAIRNIDKSMIGLPTNFQHCAHIGCSDVSQTANTIPTTGILHTGRNMNNSNNVEFQMKTKGTHLINQYEQQQPLVSHLKLIDLKIS